MKPQRPATPIDLTDNNPDPSAETGAASAKGIQAFNQAINPLLYGAGMSRTRTEIPVDPQATSTTTDGERADRQAVSAQVIESPEVDYPRSANPDVHEVDRIHEATVVDPSQPAEEPDATVIPLTREDANAEREPQRRESESTQAAASEIRLTRDGPGQSSEADDASESAAMQAQDDGDPNTIAYIGGTNGRATRGALSREAMGDSSETVGEEANEAAAGQTATPIDPVAKDPVRGDPVAVDPLSDGWEATQSPNHPPALSR